MILALIVLSAVIYYNELFQRTGQPLNRGAIFTNVPCGKQDGEVKPIMLLMEANQEEDRVTRKKIYSFIGLF